MLDSTDSAVYFENILFYYKRRFFSKYTADDTHLYIKKFQIRYGESVGIIGKNLIPEKSKSSTKMFGKKDVY